MTTATAARSRQHDFVNKLGATAAAATDHASSGTLPSSLDGSLQSSNDDDEQKEESKGEEDRQRTTRRTETRLLHHQQQNIDDDRQR